MAPSLNKAQKEAAEYTDGPLLIVAGAGTGKTTVITEKIASIVNKKLAKPEEILALTFTDKAAQEMRERIEGLLDTSYTDMQVSTFHAFCQRLIENYGFDIGISNQPRLLTEIDAWILIRQNLDKFNLNYYQPMGNPTKYIHELIKHFSKCKDEMISPADYLKYAEDIKSDVDHVQQGYMASTDEKNRLGEIANAYHAYNQILLDNDAMDFSDLIYYSVKLMEERKNVLKKIQERYKYILVDEFQDVNWSQYRLVQLLAGEKGNLTVVGDDDQSIYAFRGASVANIMRFKDDYKNVKEVVLNENYRSGQEILDIAYKSIKNNDPDRLEVKLNINKKLISKVKEAGIVRHWHFNSGEDEVIEVTNEIMDLKKKDETAVWDDFAILVRSNSNAEPFAQGLEKAKIPYEHLASRGLYRQPIVIDCVNYFKLLDNYHEPTAVYRLLRLPFWNFTEEDTQKFLNTAKRKSIPYYEGLQSASQFGLSREGTEVCLKLASLINEGAKKARFEPPSIVLYNFLDKSGYLKYLAHNENKGTRSVIRQIYQLRQWLDYIEKYEQNVSGANVAGFMEHYQQIREAGDDGQLYIPTNTPDSVNIMTAHMSKGMEFKYVFIVNMVEQKFPSRPMGNGIEVPVELIKEQLPEGDIHYQEERRLFYVASTRAKKRLYFTSADDYGGKALRKISRFLDEIKIEKEEADNLKNKSIAPVKKEREKNEEKTELIYELPKSFSFSQIKSYKDCPYQYKLANIVKLPTRNSHYFTFGNTIHNTLHEFYNQVRLINGSTQDSLFSEQKKVNKKDGIKVPSLDGLIGIYEKKWSNDWFLSKKQREDYYADGKRMLKRFYKDNEGKWTIPVALEGGFKLKIGKYILSGRIDRIDRLADGTLEIIDYKSGNSIDKATRDDKDQLLIYQIVTATMPEYRNLGKTAKLTYYYIKDAVRTDFIGKQDELVKLEEKIEKVIGSIHERDFTATPNKHICGNCSYNDICEFRI